MKTNLPNIFDISIFPFEASLSSILYSMYFITVIFTVFLVVLQKRDPVRTISWVLVLILLPFIGIILYIYFGQNYRKEKIFNRKGLRDLMQINQLVDNQVISLYDKEKIVDDVINRNRNIITLLMNNSKALLTKKNKVKIYSRGQHLFEDMKQCLEEAKDHIHLEYYIFNSDTIGKEISEILIRKVKEGVKVRVIFDDVGSWSLSYNFIRKMKKAGVEIQSFMPVRFPFFTNKVNYRNHRKIVVIDGKISFMGGMNIADWYIHGKKKLGPWRDTHLKIEGEAVKSLQTVFLIDWFFVTKQLINEKEIYFPESQITEQLYMQITASGPDSDWASIMQAYFSAITRAKHSILVSTPYFIPNESIMTALKTAALGGVDVKLIIPGDSDSRMVYFSTLSYVGDLLDAGINVYFYQAGFIHSKIMMVDGHFASVGTANMDNRSFDQNFEVNALIYDDQLTKELEEQFYKDLSQSIKITREYWDKRPKIQNLKESVVRLFSPIF